MVTGWRRAFCTSIPKDRETNKVISTEKHQNQHCENSNRSPRISSKFGFFSNPSTPRLQSQPVSSPSLRCRTSLTNTATPTSSVPNSPKLQCKTATTPMKNSSPRLFQLSNPPSPRSPSSFSLLKATLRLSKVSIFFFFFCFSQSLQLSHQSFSILITFSVTFLLFIFLIFFCLLLHYIFAE